MATRVFGPRGPSYGRRPALAALLATAGAPLLGRLARADTTTRRLRHGRFDIEIFSDGFITLPADIIAPDAGPATQAEIIRRLGGSAGEAPVRVNIPLIRAGDELILVDTGSGDKFQPSAGRLYDNLVAAGIDPATVTRVVLTHAHPDHSGGVIRPDGSLAYPNAIWHVSAAEWDYWMAPDFETRIPAVLHPFALAARRDLGAIADRVTMLRPGDEVVSGMQVLDTAGHTPGHISLELAGGDGLIVTADAVTNVVVSFEHPRWRFGFDIDQDLAIRNRTRMIERAAARKTRLLGYHWTEPGLGFAEPHGQAFRFVPEA